MLDLKYLATGNIPAISPALGASLAEAASVCLESEGHLLDVMMQVKGSIEESINMERTLVTEQAHRAWNDSQKATEWGAAGIAALLADRFLPYTLIQASRQGTGFDYWLGTESDLPFQAKAILEVSGIRQGNDSLVRRRIQRKLDQISKADSLGLIGYVVVVEFGRPLAEVAKK